MTFGGRKRNMAEKNEGNASKSKGADAFKTRAPGWSTMESTSAFRAINFELFVRPNKFVMAVGATLFLGSCGYILYMNMTRKKNNTYVTINEDGSLSSRPRTSRWD